MADAPTSPAMPNLSTPAALAEAACHVLEVTDPNVAEAILRVAQTPEGRAQIWAAVEGRSMQLGIYGPANRGKSTAIREIARVLVEAGYGGIAQVEVDHDSAASGSPGLLRFPVTLHQPTAVDESLDDDALGKALAKAAKSARRRSNQAVGNACARAASFLARGAVNGLAFESLSAWWDVYYDLCQAEFGEGHEDGFGREKGAAYIEAWKSCAGIFRATTTRAVAWNVRGPILGMIVCHGRPDYLRPAGKDPIFDGWILDVGPSIATKFYKPLDYMFGFGVDKAEGPADPFPGKNGYYVRYRKKDHAFAKSRLEDDVVEGLAKKWLPEKNVPKEGLAKFILGTYHHRRDRAVQALVDAAG